MYKNKIDARWSKYDYRTIDWASGGVFIGMVIMALCVASSRDSREEEMGMKDDEI